MKFNLFQKTIFIISPDRWGIMRISKHHYAVELAEKGNQVFFIEPPNMNNKGIKIKDCNDHPNIHIVSYKPVYRGKRFLPAFIYRLMLRKQIQLICKSARARPDIVWAFDPYKFENLSWFHASLSIFHPVDIFSREYLPREAYTADICFCSSNEIANSVIKAGKPTYFINHGLNHFFCNKAQELLARKKGKYIPEGAQIKVGYIGNLLLEGTDRITMQKVVQANPEVQFVFWGQYERSKGNLGESTDPGVDDFISFLIESNNVELKGAVHPLQLSTEMFEMDMFWLCLNTQKSRVCTAGTNSHKILEYLSTGKAFVSHYMSNYDGTDLLYMLPDQTNENYLQLFKEVISKVKQGEPAELVQKRLRFALDNAYSRQIEKIETLINQLYEMKKICIITNNHISYNPRVLKEADAFSMGGYKVSVVTVNNNDMQRKFDEELMQKRSWKLVTVNYRKTIGIEKRKWLYLSLKHKFFNLLSGITVRAGIGERAANKVFDDLKKLATKQKADLYVVHHSEVLGAGYAAAKKNKSLLGLDAEDFQTGITEIGSHAQDEKLIEFIEAKYLKHCQYLTAASKGISEAYAEKYSISKPAVILNVFPTIDLSVREVRNPVKFYWYSQVISLTRGLDQLLEAAGKVNEPFELHFRGSFPDTHHRQLMLDMIIKLNLQDKVFFHDPILADEIIPESTNYDVGLALESDVSFNRYICVTNKVFSYLMSGLAIIGTATYGQKDIFRHFPNAVCRIQMNNADALADAMLCYIQNPEKLYIAKKAARKAALEEFNWEKESGKLLNLVGDIFNQNSGVN